jgi:hypothetical protein
MHATFDDISVKSANATDGKPRRPASLKLPAGYPGASRGNERVGRMTTAEPKAAPAPAASLGLKQLGFLQDAVEMAAAYVRREEDAKFEAISARVRC